MKILLAPSETKLSGGKGKLFCKENFSFPDHYDKRLEVVNKYEKFIKTSSLEELSLWFGIKNLIECERYSGSIKNKPTMKAIQRYTGVAFDALNYSNLKWKEQNYIDENVLIFSNLFGILKASDLIPDYKYKQGAQLDNFNIERFYKENLKGLLDNYLGDDIIDLRSGHYDKFYKITSPAITFKFLKNGKSISHWAKHYRGLVLRTIAKNNINNFSDLMSMSINGLKLIEIQERKKTRTLIMKVE